MKRSLGASVGFVTKVTVAAIIGFLLFKWLVGKLKVAPLESVAARI